MCTAVTAGNHFRSLFGEQAGWAQAILFAADLKTQQHSLPPDSLGPGEDSPPEGARSSVAVKPGNDAGSSGVRKRPRKNYGLALVNKKHKQ